MLVARSDRKERQPPEMSRRDEGQEVRFTMSSSLGHRPLQEGVTRGWGRGPCEAGGGED